MSRCVALVQARMSSTRFPGKVLEPLAGLPSIVYLVQRARTARRLDAVVVVTSTDPSDDALVRCLDDAGIAVFRGALHDVLARYAAAAAAFPADDYVRLTGDCPLLDPKLVDAVVDARRRAGADYASNIDPPSFPDGMDCECFTAGTLARAAREATSAPHREHVTLWMREAAAGLRRVNVAAPVDASHLRLTVDYRDDLDAVRRVLDALPPHAPFDVYDLLRVIGEHPQIGALNPHRRNEALCETPPAPTAPNGAPR